MPTPVKAGDILIVPPRSGSNRLVRTTMKWSQDWGREMEKDYYMSLAEVKGKNGRKILLFIQHDYYKSDEDTYELTVDSRCQYGQRNKEGDGRFVVFHDPYNKSFQHRFTTAAFESSRGEPDNYIKITNLVLGYAPDVAPELNIVIAEAKKLFGDRLHTF